MLVTNKLSTAQTKIIRQICYIQLQSITRLIENRSYVDPDVIEKIQEDDVAEEEFMEGLEIKMENFNRLNEDPHILIQMKDDDLSTIRHILTNIQHRFQDRYPNAIKNLWKRLFFIEDLKNFKQN